MFIVLNFPDILTMILRTTLWCESIDGMQVLDGRELAGFIKERQAKQVRALRQSWKVVPKFAIIKTKNDPVIDTYIRIKRQYAADILVESDMHSVPQDEILELIEKLNSDPDIHGIIVQLPLDNPAESDEILNSVAPEKDIDGLGEGATFDSATAMAINWLFGGYGVELKGKPIAIIGHGRLVGAPLARMWRASNYNVTVFDSKTSDLDKKLRNFEIIVSATGVPRLIKSSMISESTVVIDAGTASDGGVLVGDLEDDILSRQDLTIAPSKGGVGPLTVAALIDNVITAARKVADQKGQQDL